MMWLCRPEKETEEKGELAEEVRRKRKREGRWVGVEGGGQGRDSADIERVVKRKGGGGAKDKERGVEIKR